MTTGAGKNRADPALRIGGTAMPENMAALAGATPRLAESPKHC